MCRVSLSALIVGFLSFCYPTSAIQFTPGDFYGTNYFSNQIVHYSSGGAVLESMTVPSALAEDVKGLAFGPDGLLYAVAERGSGFAVLALDASGNVQQTYPYAPNYIGGNLSSGKIAFGANGRFYVGGGAGLVQFNLGSPNSGTLVRSGDTYDVEALPSGNLLVLENYDLYEVTGSGAPVRKINPTGIYFTDNRGVEYDPATGNIYVTMLGHTGAYDQLMKFDNTGQLLSQATFWYGDDMYLADDGRLIVGSRTQSPGIFTKNLVPLGSFAGSERMFVTQLVPEPATALLFVSGILLVYSRRRPTRSAPANDRVALQSS